MRDFDAGDQIVIDNATKDPNYKPYCMRCPGLVRMAKVCERGWRCSCGAVCDLREDDSKPLPELSGFDLMNQREHRRRANYGYSTNW